MHKYLFLNKYDDTSFENLQQQESSREDCNDLSIFMFDDFEPENSNFSFRYLDDANIEECITR